MTITTLFNILETLRALPNEVLGVMLYAATMGCLFLFHRLFQKEGLFLFIIVAIIIANIQSLQVIQLSFFHYPFAMGSILFTTSLLATDMLAEYYGKNAAQKGIWLGFFGILMMSSLMWLTISHAPVSTAQSTAIHQAMTLLFMPTPALMLASLIAYLIGQYTDMLIFLHLKKKAHHRFLKTRTFLAMSFGTFIDNTLFSVLAWRIFYRLEMDTVTFIKTYILGVFLIRIFINLVNSPWIAYMRAKRPFSTPMTPLENAA